MTLVASSDAATSSAGTPPVCRILLVDGQRLFRHALRVLLTAEEDFAVVGEAGRGSEALELVGTLQPDVVVTDLHLGDSSAVELIRAVRARSPRVAILVLTAVRARDAAAAVRKAGAQGYLLKDHGRAELLTALRSALTGRWYRSSAPVLPMPDRVDPLSLSARAAYLTERQRQVLRSVARGQRTREIAALLGVSVRAVHKQRERLRDALQLNSTAALTRFALREGFAEETPASR
jgi:two-component system NarL family response regulator